MHPNPKVLVVGGGVGGLATAVALRKVGMEVTVLERAPRLAAVGAGIQIAPNAIKALRELGLAERIESLGTAAETFQFRSSGGAVLVEAQVGELARKHGAPAVFLSRADLLRTLFEALDEDVVHFGARVESVAQDQDGVTGVLTDGTEIRADLLVSADGVGSAIRSQLFPGAEPVYAGYQDWRAVVDYIPPGFPSASWFMAWGTGARFGVGHAGQGRLFWFALINTPPGSKEDAVGGKEGLLRRFEGWAEPVGSVLRATPPEAINWADIRDIKPMRRWSHGRITLLGDAAHATTPNLGRGAGEAIEDAVSLARNLAALTDLDDAVAVSKRLRAYEGDRRSQTASVTRRSRRMGQVGQLENPLACRLRETVMRLTPDRVAIRSLESDFKHNVEPLYR